MLPPEADGTADYDLFIWGWSWGPDPSGPLEVFICDAIGGSSDSLWCDENYDAIYAKQIELGGDERKAVLDEMQQYWYDQAPYHILYYDDNLHAYRTDKFANWQNQPTTGTPLFTYGTLNYTLLELAADASASPSAGPSDGASGAPATPAPSGDGSGSSTSGDNTLLIVGSRRGRRGRRRRARPGAAPRGGRGTTSSLADPSAHDPHGGEPVPGSPRLT